MATGDMTNNLRNLQKAMKLVRYEDEIDISGLSKGIPNNFLPVYHYVFTMFSPAVAEKIADMDVELFGKSDLKFMEGVYKVLRDLFGYKPPITRDQFFSKGFAERKVIMCAEVINLVHKKHRSMCPKRETSGSFRANASRDSSANLGPKVGFQRPKTHEWRAERADSIPPVSQVVRKRADRGPSRPNSARSNRPGSAGQDTSQAGKSSSPELALHNIAVPKTPGILKAKTSAVQVVYVPRAVPADTEDKQPVEVIAMSPAAGVEQGKVVEANTQSEQLSQVLAQNSTTHTAVELLMERVMKLEEQMTAVKLNMEKSAHKEGANSEESRETMAAFMSSVNSKIDNVTARLLLAENRVAILESKILSSYSTAQLNGYPETDQTARQNPTTASTPCTSNVIVNGVSPSPIKQTQDAETNGQLAAEEQVTPVSTEHKEVRSSTPVDKAQNPPLTFTCIDAATQEKAERLEALMSETDGILKSAGQIAGNIVNGRE